MKMTNVCSSSTWLITMMMVTMMVVKMMMVMTMRKEA